MSVEITSQDGSELTLQMKVDLSGSMLNIEDKIQKACNEADQLAAATVHWLRHTGISDDVKIRPREHVRDDAGHSSGAITDKYIDVELRERHGTARKKRIKPEFME